MAMRLALHLVQRGLRRRQLALQLSARADFLLQYLVDLRQIVGGGLNPAFKFVGFLQRLSDLAGLHMIRNFLLEHRVDHAQFSCGLLDRVLNGFILIKRTLQRSGWDGDRQVL